MPSIKTDDYELWNNVTGFPILIEAPHRYYDLYSGEIARDLVELLGAKLLLMNVQRRTVYDCARGGIEENASTKFQEVHEKLSMKYLFPTVQIHGMTDYGLDVIISSGSTGPYKEVFESSLFPILCARIPYKITIAKDWDDCSTAVGTRFGATQNPQGHFNNKYSIPFAHIELSYWIRKYYRKEIVETLAAAITEWYINFWMNRGRL